MKVFEIENGHLKCWLRKFQNIEEARKYIAPSIEMVEAPDYVYTTWGYDPSKTGDARFIKPETNQGDGWVYNEENGSFWNPEAQRESERRRLHSETTDDTMQAYRKLRQGDKTIDWQAWLDTLDAYNVAIEETKNQEGYPLKVTYPEYPTKPTA